MMSGLMKQGGLSFENELKKIKKNALTQGILNEFAQEAGVLSFTQMEALAEKLSKMEALPPSLQHYFGAQAATMQEDYNSFMGGDAGLIKNYLSYLKNWGELNSPIVQQVQNQIEQVAKHHKDGKGQDWNEIRKELTPLFEQIFGSKASCVLGRFMTALHDPRNLGDIKDLIAYEGGAAFTAKKGAENAYTVWMAKLNTETKSLVEHSDPMESEAKEEVSEANSFDKNTSKIADNFVSQMDALGLMVDDQA